jgi:hypothetical protein
MHQASSEARAKLSISKCFLFAAALFTATASAGPARAYIPGTRWTTTASGSAGNTGDPVTLTWSIVPDGTTIPDEGASNFISYFDGLFGAGPGGSDLTQRPWFTYFQQGFARWNQLGGVNFVYQPHDDGTQLENLSGSLGVRGDIRIGGANVDGPSNTLAFTYLPNGGDMVFDTGETTVFTDASNNHRAIRDVLMHELGHAFGINHVVSSTDALLMEPFLDTSIDGPQLDDIRAIQGTYGDVNEKSNNFAGNDIAANATPLGLIAAGATRTIGADAAGSNQAVMPTQTDFVSIANSSDTDFYSFSVSATSLLSASLTPLGGVFSQGSQGGAQSSFDANARNDLTLAILGADGSTILGLSNNTAAGGTEGLANLTLQPGSEYFARITGSTANVQLYELSLTAAVLFPSGDFDKNGVVDGADFLLWQREFGATGASLAADANHDNRVNAADLSLWQAHFGETVNAATPAARHVPEPDSMSIVAPAFMAVATMRKRLVLQKGRLVNGD